MIEKQHNISIDLETSQASSNWFEDMTQDEQNATDQILDYFKQSGANPHVSMQGDVVDVITAIVNSLKKATPDHLSSDLKLLTDYIARWLCAYFDQTNAATIQIAFGFNAQMPEKQGV